MPRLQFPDGFVWGVATSAYQIEGAVDVDGRGESIWDRFCNRSGAIDDGSSGAVACDHYHQFAEDVALLQKLGVDAYRFSIAWPRVMPTGRGRVNDAGVDFYSRLIDALLRAGIEPYPTLYHWDLPQALEDAGGWPARATAEAFTEFADVLQRRLGDRIRNWTTLNEPWCASMLGYRDGVHAPGRSNHADALAASHHLLLAHGRAVPVLRERGAAVGLTLNLAPVEPASPSDADRDAARHLDGTFNRWFCDPVFGRGYPEDIVDDHMRSGHIDDLEFVHDGDLDAISRPIDFLGVNYYYRHVARAEVAGNARAMVEPGPHRTDMGWEVYPRGLTALLRRVHDDYGPASMMVTENGASYATGPDREGRVRDRSRQTFLRDHFAAAHEAMAAGIPLAGYFVWSLLDNFEWARGYAQRFGIVWVDYDTGRRLPKDSARWYARVIAENSLDAP